VAEARAKPKKLDWQGGIAETGCASDSEKVSLKQEKKENALTERMPQADSTKPQKLKLKRETKGRSGHPVIVLFEITPALTTAALESFAKDLKAKLGCGGTMENNSIILQTQNVERVEKELAKRAVMSLRAGGF
jgi:translation initiation factor 1 (eIF-1/SUI1)